MFRLLPHKEYVKARTRASGGGLSAPRRPKPPGGGLDPPIVKRPHRTSEQKRTKRETETKKTNDWKSKAGALAVFGLSAAAVGLLIANATEQVLACDEAKLTFSNVTPTPGVFPKWINFLNGPPGTVDITYTADNDYKPNDGQDTVDISGTNTKLDGTSPIINVISPTVIRVSCGQSNCASISSTSGTGTPNCSIEDAINTAIVEGATDIGSVLSKTAGDIFKGLSGALPIVLIVIGVILIFMFVIPAFKS